MCRNEAITEDELKLITKTYQQVLHITKLKTHLIDLPAHLPIIVC